MIATCTIDDSGQIQLPEPLRRIFKAEPGVRLRAEVTADRIEISRDVPEVTATAISPDGRLILAPTGIRVDSGKAVRESREEADSRLRRS